MKRNGQVVLDPAMRADEAGKLILRRLLTVMHEQEAGIRADVDPECLHEYRVAVRRTRTALGQFGRVFPEEPTARFREGFRTLGSASNELRDLDVYLLAEADYRALLPSTLKDAITPLFTLLKRRRAEAFSHQLDYLQSTDYAQFMAEWEAFLNDEEHDGTTAKHADTAIIDLARKRIYKRFRRIIKDGTYILDHTEDDLLHALRLECKRLRYLLEFSASLFPQKSMTRLIGQLKRLQDNLGEFTDLAVQQEALLALADQLPLEDPDVPHALIASGALIGVLARRQEAVRAEFAATFTKFATRANQKRYRHLFDSR